MRRGITCGDAIAASECFLFVFGLSWFVVSHALIFGTKGSTAVTFSRDFPLYHCSIRLCQRFLGGDEHIGGFHKTLEPPQGSIWKDSDESRQAQEVQLEEIHLAEEDKPQDVA